MSHPVARIVKKSNGLIEAKYTLTLQEQRVILAALAKIHKDDIVTDDVMYLISVHEIADLASIPAQNLYGEIKMAAERLRSDRTVIIEIEPDGIRKKPRVMHTSWLQTCTYCEAEATVEVRFTKDILPYIAQLKAGFTQYRLLEAAGIKTPGGLRLFERCMMELGLGGRPFEITIPEFKSWLGISSDTYPRVTDLKKRVLIPAIDDVNKNTALEVSYGQRKRGRDIYSFQFTVRRKTASQKSPKLSPGRVETEIKSVEKKRMTKAQFLCFARPQESVSETIARAKAEGYVIAFKPF